MCELTVVQDCQREPRSNGWELPGSAGGETSRWTVTEIHGKGNERTYRCDISLLGEFYGETLRSPASDGFQDFSLVIRGLQLRYDELFRLADQLRAWLSGPLAKPRHSGLELSCGMGGLFDQSLHLTLGQRDDMLSGGRLIATLEYVIGRMRGELAYPVDESCLSIMTEGIESVLEGPSSSISTSR